jgi:hypothetical protein
MKYYKVLRDGVLVGKLVPTVHVVYFGSDVIDEITSECDRCVTELSATVMQQLFGKGEMVPVDLQIANRFDDREYLETVEEQQKILSEIVIPEGFDEMEGTRLQQEMCTSYLSGDVGNLLRLSRGENFLMTKDLFLRDKGWRERLISDMRSEDVVLWSVGLYHVLRNKIHEGDMDLREVLEAEGFEIKEVDVKVDVNKERRC